MTVTIYSTSEVWTVPIYSTYKFQLLLFIAHLKFGLTTETKIWRQHYGKACNLKYSTEMEEIFTFIEDVVKRLSRPLKDLDDVRFAMAALKDIRENEIRIDMSISPIEVCASCDVSFDMSCLT